MFNDLPETLDFRGLETGLGQSNEDLNELIDDLAGDLVDNTPLGQLVSTGNEEQPPFTDDPDNVGIFDPTGFVFDLLG